MNSETQSNEVKILVAQSTTIHRENLGEGDDGFQILTRYELFSNSPTLYFSSENWIKAFYLCQCELESKEYFSLNHISGEESTISFDVKNGEYVQLNPLSKFVYSPISSDYFAPIFYLNPYKTERICNILQRFDQTHIYIASICEKNLIPKNQWDDKVPLDFAQNECHYKIDLLRNSNIGEFSLPKAISSNSLDIYLCIISEYCADNNEIKYYLSSNISNVIDFIPERIRIELNNYIGCKSWEQIHNGDDIKGQKICQVVKKINESIKAWGYIGPNITFHVGNELVCQYKVPLSILHEMNRVAWLFKEMKSNQ